MSSAAVEGNLVRSVTHLRLSLWERVRVLFGASVTVVTQVMVTGEPGDARTASAWVTLGKLPPEQDVHYDWERVAFFDDAQTLTRRR